MYAAAEGHSKLGIPKEVGEEFVRADVDGEGKPMPLPAGGELNDREAAEALRDRELPSPVKFGDYWLFDVRITGTGAAWRDALGEYGIRDPETWLTDDFVDRCNGLPVIDGHTDAPGLNSEEYRERAIGQIVLPYRKGSEVWGIAKIYDADAAVLMQTTKRSTSPGVAPPKGATPILLESGAQVLEEPLPLNLDHLAICELGVWDKDGPPEGVRLDELVEGKGTVMADSDREKELEKERDDAKMRADAAEKERDDARTRADAAEKELKDRKDAEESEKEAEEKAEKERDDARRKRHDAGKHDGAHKDCSRCDAEEKAEKDRKDGVDNVDANRGTDDIKDARTQIAALKDSNAAMQAQIDALQRANEPLTIEDRDHLARAFRRYDPLFQMLLDSTPAILPGEKPISYRKRCANALRKYTTSFQNYAFHDSQQEKDFELVELAIFDEATAYARNPRSEDIVGQVREIKDTTTLPGKVITKFVGDQHAVWAPFKQPVQHFFQRVKQQPARNASF